jgi:hypothetical protein
LKFDSPTQAERSPGYGRISVYLNCVTVQPASNPAPKTCATPQIAPRHQEFRPFF